MTIQKNEKLGAYEALHGEPDLPSYSEGIETGTSLTGSDLPGRPSTNYLQVLQSQGSINGAYTIDTDRRVPTALLGLSEGEPKWLAMLTGSNNKVKPNAMFKSEYGSIDLKLAVRGSKTAKIEVEAGHGSCSIVIDGREPGTVLDLSVDSGSTVRIALPNNFNGVVRGGCEYGGRVRFSEALNARTTTFAEDGTNCKGGRYFIGDWTINEPVSVASPVASTSSSPAVEPEWKGDTLVVSSKYADVQLETWDEREAQLVEAARKKAERVGWDGWWAAVMEEFGKVGGACGGLIMTCFNPARHDTSFRPAGSV